MPRQGVAAPGVTGAQAATFVVAARNASTHIRATSDFVCTGSRPDDEEIQDALDTLPASGGKVALTEGVFTLTAQLARAIDNVTIEGAGRGTRLNFDGSTAVISAGSQAGWCLAGFDADAGGVDVSSATQFSVNIWKDGAQQLYVNQIRLKGAVDMLLGVSAGPVLTITRQSDGAVAPIAVSGLEALGTESSFFGLDAQYLTLPDTGELTISNGLADVVSLPQGTFYTVAAESGVTDDLDALSTFAAIDGRVVCLRPKVGHTITVKHTDADNKILIVGGADVVLNPTDILWFIGDAELNRWLARG